jgi:hypothetical protein
MDEIWTPEPIRNAQFALFVSFVVAVSMVAFGIVLFASRPVGTHLPLTKTQL